jgi:hypothetical protein
MVEIDHRKGIKGVGRDYDKGLNWEEDGTGLNEFNGLLKNEYKKVMGSKS